MAFDSDDTISHASATQNSLPSPLYSSLRSRNPPKPQSHQSLTSISTSNITSSLSGAQAQQQMHMTSADPDATNTNQLSDDSWGSYIFTFVSDIAGRAWQFARDSAFQGFVAGGGDGYDWRFATPRRVSSTPSISESGSTADPARAAANGQANGMPGGFPAEDKHAMDYNIDTHGYKYYASRSNNSLPGKGRYRYGRPPSYDDFEQAGFEERTGRPAKRQQVTQGEAWTVVNPPHDQLLSRASSAARLQSASRSTSASASEAALSARRSRPSAALPSSSRRFSPATTHSSPLAPSNLARPASAASTRSPPVPSTSRRRKRESETATPRQLTPRHQNENITPRSASRARAADSNKRSSNHGLGSPSFIPVPVSRPVSSASGSNTPAARSTSKPGPRPSSAASSPAAAEAAADVERYAAKRRREERKADASMVKLQRQMRDMIRQGREALAATVEIGHLVDDLDWDGEYDDDEFEDVYDVVRWG